MSDLLVPQVPGYDVGAPLGEGASSTVWRGRRRSDGLAVALKVVRPVTGDVDDALREAGLLASVRHRHVVHLYDVLPLAAAGAERPDAVVLVTQLAAGGSLAQLLSRRSILSPGELVTVLQPVAGALADLHARSVVHGDLSTGNVLFRADGMPLLADLGTARVAGERGGAWGTGAGDGMVAPEVLEGFPATPESDVYQVGALAWLALTGRPPGPGHDRVPLEEVGTDLDPALVELVTRCTAPQPEDRPDAEELATALMGVATPAPVEVAPDADPAHGLTQRLRQLAQQDEAEADEVEPGPRWRRWAASVRRARRVDDAAAVGPEARRGGAHREAPAEEGRRSSPWAVALVFLVAAVAGAAGFLLVGGSVREVVAGRGGDDGAVVSSAQVLPSVGRGDEAAAGTTGPVVAAATTSGPVPGEDPLGEGLRSAVQELVDVRAEAWEASDPALLADALAEESPAMAWDARELERARSEEVTYPHVAFEVDDVEVVEETERGLLVTATVVRAALEARDDGGWLLRAPRQVDTVQLELVREDDRWQLWAWTDEVR
ncbi:serine/threonine-protein kinase [Ornithinimicrobium flavum]|uniref:serine/threonine-protein kinase n=1 Tax=Ornithinimicrobium flavum TaxID=1288636 RepID=UPI00106F3A95|nr:serine/threonine-protein kinase [Ornithinimicrobium flavum]